MSDSSAMTASTSELAKKKKRGLFGKMAVRSFFAILMITGVVIVFNLGHAWLCGFIVAVQVGAFVELTQVQHKYYQNENERGGLKLFRSLRFAWLLVALYAAYGMSWMIAPFTAGEQFFNAAAQYAELVGLPTVPTHYHDMVSLALFASVFILTVLSFEKGRYREQLLNISWTITSLLVVIFQMKSAIKNIHNGVFWLVFPMALVIINDTMAYFCGVSLGRRFYKGVFMELSPNKTLEGFIGGGIFTVIAGYMLPALLQHIPYVICTFDEYNRGVSVDQCAFASEFEPVTLKLQSLVPRVLQDAVEGFSLPSFSVVPVQVHGVLLAVFASTVAPFGGFLASAIKRAYKVKDFSDLIPEHGGIVDRMDCQFIMALATLIYFQGVVGPRIGVTDTVLAVRECPEVSCAFDIPNVSKWATQLDLAQQRLLMEALTSAISVSTTASKEGSTEL